MQTEPAWRSLFVVSILSSFLGLTACGSGSSSSFSGSALSVPTEVSAVSTKSSSGGNSATFAASASIPSPPDGKEPSSYKHVGLKSIVHSIHSAASDLPAASDYTAFPVKKFVEIKALDQFSMIEQIFDAFSQTNYEDNVGLGPYKCKVAWEENGEGGTTITQLQTWTINVEVIADGSDAADANGITRITMWTEEIEDGETSLVRALVQIDEAPTFADDGSMLTLGVWSINAEFGSQTNAEDYFYADAIIIDESANESRLRIIDQFVEEQGGSTFPAGIKAVIYRSPEQGYGAVEVPDWGSCFGQGGWQCPNGVPLKEIKFSYNENYLTVDEDSVQTSFDRNDEHEIVHRYKLFKASDGSDIEKDLDFGFPVVTEDNQFGWYGAWQDRHQLWIGGQSLADGTVVFNDNVAPGQSASQYTVDAFSGSLSKITLVQGDLAQVLNIPAQVWIGDCGKLVWDTGTSKWNLCVGDDGMGACDSEQDFTNSLPSLENLGGNGNQKFININHFDFDAQQMTNYVYLTASHPDAGSGAGFYEATQGQNGQFTSNGTMLNTGALADGFDMWFCASGMTYIEYVADFDGPVTTSGWVEKVLTDFDQTTWTPTFDDDEDREFRFEQFRQYFISNKGMNFRVTRVAESSPAVAADYEVFQEVQEVAKPGSGLSDTYTNGTVLVNSWDPENNSTYVLETNPNSANYLLLKYNTVGSNDSNNNVSVGDVVTGDQWGLMVQGTTGGPLEVGDVMYNYEYQSQGEFQGGVTYLVDSNGDHVLLSEPLRFSAIPLANTNNIVQNHDSSQWLSYSLMFDGHMSGLPDSWWELQKIGFTSASSDKIPNVLSKNVVIPDGTLLTDSTSGLQYYTKAVDVGVFLGFVVAMPLGAPDMTAASALVLANEIPAKTANGVSTSVPSGTLKYVEGKAVSN